MSEPIDQAAWSLACQVQMTAFVIQAHHDADVEAVIRLAMTEAVRIAQTIGAAETLAILGQQDQGGTNGRL